MKKSTLAVSREEKSEIRQIKNGMWSFEAHKPNRGRNRFAEKAKKAAVVEAKPQAEAEPKTAPKVAFAGDRASDVLAKDWYETAAKEADEGMTGDNALFLKALHVLVETGHSKDEQDAAVVTLDRLSAEGHVRATVLLGLLYEHGAFVPKDLGLAKHYYEAATYYGAANGEYRLGALLLSDSPLRNAELGVAHVRNAAAKGLKEALDALGTIYLTGNTVAKDPVKAEHFYRLAANRGLGLAYYHLSELARDRKDSQAADQDLALAKANGYDPVSRQQDALLPYFVR